MDPVQTGAIGVEYEMSRWHEEGGVAITQLQLHVAQRVTHLAFTNCFANALSVYAHMGENNGAGPVFLKGASRLMQDPHHQDDAYTAHVLRVFSPGDVHSLLLRASNPSPRWLQCALPRVYDVVLLNEPYASYERCLQYLSTKRRLLRLHEQDASDDADNDESG